MSDGAVLRVRQLGFPWETADPFLFVVFHQDAYPAGNDRLGPDASLEGRDIGQDFAGKDGWRMYHGATVPGFPQHPHRGFETVTVIRKGYIDHSDSLGATARYGPGDVQWLTAGQGIVHAEMFPLLDPEEPNPLELFQIWLNLPGADKFAEPHFSMLWREMIPDTTYRDEKGRAVEIVLSAGKIGVAQAPAPPPKSWASRSDTDVVIATVKMDPGAIWTLPAASAEANRTLYFFRGAELSIGGETVTVGTAVDVRSDRDVTLENGAEVAEMLLLQGKPIGEPVVQYGPFVMNTPEEIRQAFADYRRTEFGGWPWPVDDPVLPRDEGRLARHTDGRMERAPTDSKSALASRD